VIHPREADHAGSLPALRGHLGQVPENYWLKGRRGVRHYFFTDDNFARNPRWEAVFDGLIRLRGQEGIHIDFMMQVDVQAPRVQGFVDKAARAGCVQVFIGMESVRDDNLHAGGKPQNRASDYRDMIACWHEVGVVCHVGYIIGLPCDTYERVMEDVRTLRETLHVDQASFFMLAPLPGSRDHQAAVRAGVALDPDYRTSSRRSDGVFPTAQTSTGDRPTLIHRSCGLAPPACWTPAEPAGQWERLRCCTH